MEGELSVPGSGARLELFVRSSVPPAARECQSSTVERLRALDASGCVAAVAVHPWEKRIPLDGSTRETRDAQRAYAVFSEWAREHGADLSPFFETRECYSSVTGEEHTALVLPVACLAIFEGDRLRGVFPHATETRTYTVSDALDALETTDDHEISSTDAR